MRFEMAKKRIFTVGFDLPGDEFEYIRADSTQTLLDADIILFQPTLGSTSEQFDHYRGGSKAIFWSSNTNRTLIVSGEEAS
jgi:hypothetical protein